MNVGIIGGSDGLGKTLIYYFRDDFKVFISARNHDKGRKVADDLNVSYIESNCELAGICDVVIVSVPIHHTSDVIREIAPCMRRGSLMLDVTSVKEEPLKTMQEVLPDWVEYIPTHPVFGPRTTELDNQVIVLTADKKGEWYGKVYDYLKSKNLRIIETTASKHDFMMSIVQVLTHFSFISTAYAIEKLKVDLDETEDYESPIYNLMIDMIARIVSQNPYLTYYIQSLNNNGVNVRNTFAEAVCELRDVINAGDDESFIEIAESATAHMGDIKDALGRSDKAIKALTYEFRYLKDSVGAEIGLKDIYTDKVYVGILESINAKNASLNIDSEVIHFRLAGIRILTRAELYYWKRENDARQKDIITCRFVNNINIELIKETLVKLYGIEDINVVKKEAAGDFVILTFEIESIYEEDVLNIEKLFAGFGGEIQ